MIDFGRSHKTMEDTDKKQQTAEHAATTINCQCGMTYRLGNKSRHEKSQLHFENMNPTPGKPYRLPDGSLGYKCRDQ